MKYPTLFKLWVQTYGPTASFERVWETLRCSIYDHKNEQPLHFYIITLQISSCKAPNRVPGSDNEKYFKVMKRLKSLQKAEAYLEPKQASMMELFVNILNGRLFLQ